MKRTIDEIIADYARFIVKSDGSDDYAAERRNFKQSLAEWVRSKRPDMSRPGMTIGEMRCVLDYEQELLEDLEANEQST